MTRGLEALAATCGVVAHRPSALSPQPSPPVVSQMTDFFPISTSGPLSLILADRPTTTVETEHSTVKT